MMFSLHRLRSRFVLLVCAIGLISGGCGGGHDDRTGDTVLRAVYTDTDGKILEPNEFPLKKFVCTVEAADLSEAPSVVALGYNGPIYGPTQATLRNGRYQFFLSVGRRVGGAAFIYWGGTPRSPILPPLSVPTQTTPSGGPGIGVPIFVTSASGTIINGAVPPNTPVSLTIDADELPDTVTVTYEGPLTGPAQVSRVNDQYVIDATTLPGFPDDTSTIIYLSSGEDTYRAYGPSVGSGAASME